MPVAIMIRPDPVGGAAPGAGTCPAQPADACPDPGKMEAGGLNPAGSVLKKRYNV